MKVFKISVLIALALTCVLSSFAYAEAIPYESLKKFYGLLETKEQTEFLDSSEIPEWANESVRYLSGYGIVSGSEGMFYPSRNITREEFVKIIITAFGLYDKTAKCEFTDVPKTEWYYPFVASAKKLGITSGVSADRFGTGEYITREQLVTLAYNTAKYAGAEFESSGDFIDEAEISDYAKEAASALKGAGVISGDERGNFNPLNFATRSETCKIIYNLIFSER